MCTFASAVFKEEVINVDIYICSFILSIAFIAIILMFVKMRVLDFKYSVLWILSGIVMVVLSLNRKLTMNISHLLKISYPSRLLLFFVFIFVLFSMFFITVVISRMQKKITRLVQEVAVMRSIQDKGDIKK